MSDTHCPVCHSPRNKHKKVFADCGALYCELTHSFRGISFYYTDTLNYPSESFKECGEVVLVQGGIWRTPLRVEGKTLRDRIAAAYRYVRQSLRTGGINTALRSHLKAIEPENILLTWALLALIPEEIPCANVRPADLAGDPESIFASCDVVQFIRNRGD